jgi:hypothetical protein
MQHTTDVAAVELDSYSVGYAMVTPERQRCRAMQQLTRQLSAHFLEATGSCSRFGAATASTNRRSYYECSAHSADVAAAGDLTNFVLLGTKLQHVECALNTPQPNCKHSQLT